MLVTCWSHDCLKFEHVLFLKLTSEVVQLRNVIYNNKKYFALFSTNITFKKKLIPEICTGCSNLSLSAAKSPILSVVMKERARAKMASFAD